MKKKILYITAALCGAVTLSSIGAAALYRPQPAAEQPAQPPAEGRAAAAADNDEPVCTEYVLRECNGQLALYDKNGMLLTRYEIYTGLLPQTDRDALHLGIPVCDEDALRRLLEDFGA